MSYNIPKRFSQSEKAKVHRIIRQGIKTGKPARQIKTELRSKGLGYRDTNLFSDIARKKATFIPVKEGKKVSFKSLNPEQRKASLKWYDNTIQKYRDKYKEKTGKSLAPSKAVKIWERAKRQSYDKLSDSEIDEAEEIWEYYEAM